MFTARLSYKRGRGKSEARRGDGQGKGHPVFKLEFMRVRLLVSWRGFNWRTRGRLHPGIQRRSLLGLCARSSNEAWLAEGESASKHNDRGAANNEPAQRLAHFFSALVSELMAFEQCKCTATTAATVSHRANGPPGGLHNGHGDA